MSRLDVSLGRCGINVNVLDARLPERPTEPMEVMDAAVEMCPNCGKQAAYDSIVECENCGDWFCEMCRPGDHSGELMDMLRMCRKPCCVVRAAIGEIHRLREELREQRGNT